MDKSATNYPNQWMSLHGDLLIIVTHDNKIKVTNVVTGDQQEYDIE